MNKKILLLAPIIFITACLKAGNGMPMVVECVKQAYQLMCKEVLEDHYEILATLDFSTHLQCGNVRWNIDKLELKDDTKNPEQSKEQHNKIIRALLMSLEKKAREEQMTLLTIPQELNRGIREYIKEYFTHKYDMPTHHVYILAPEHYKKTE